MLTALGSDRDLDGDSQVARAYVGAAYVLEALYELRAIRKALTTPPKD